MAPGAGLLGEGSRRRVPASYQALSGLSWCIDHRIRVANLSSARPRKPDVPRRHSRSSWAGITLVCAAGKAPGPNTVGYPAKFGSSGRRSHRRERWGRHFLRAARRSRWPLRSEHQVHLAETPLQDHSALPRPLPSPAWWPSCWRPTSLTPSEIKASCSRQRQADSSPGAGRRDDQRGLSIERVARKSHSVEKGSGGRMGCRQTGKRRADQALRPFLSEGQSACDDLLGAVNLMSIFGRWASCPWAAGKVRGDRWRSSTSPMEIVPRSLRRRWIPC